MKKRGISMILSAALLMSSVLGTAASASAAEKHITTGGKPWIDAELKENIRPNMKLDPKQDFHLYVNYDWLKNARIKEGYSTTSSFMEVALDTTAKAKSVLTDKNLTGRDAKLVQDYYNAYMNWDARNKLGVAPAKKTVTVLKNIHTLPGLTAFLCNLDASYGVPTFISTGNTTGLNDSSHYIVDVSPEGLLLGDSAEYKNRTELGERYYSAAKTLAEYMLKRVGYSGADAKKAFDDTIDLETQLAACTMTTADQKADDYIQKINNVYTAAQLQELSPQYPVMKILRALGISESHQFLVEEPKNLQEVNELYTQKNLSKLKNYLIVKYLMGSATSLDRGCFDANIAYGNTVNGSKGKRADEDYAFNAIKDRLIEPMERAYMKKYPADEAKRKIHKICEQVIAQYEDMLEGETWLSKSTRDKAIEKLKNVQINSVYPDKWHDYSSLDFSGLSYYDCGKALQKYNLKEDASHTNAKVDKQLWDFSTLEANAYYNPQDNSINILLGILGGALYSDDMTEEQLYGSIGAVIGHEISHAFDTNGAQFDKNGNYANWWQEKDFDAFKKRADKLAKYYDGITVTEGNNAIGQQIKTEAIADMTGVKCVLGIAAKTKNFDYDKFFRAYASVWRCLNTWEREYYCLKQDEHPLHFLRTNVTLQQFDEFLKTYNIKPGDNMYLAPQDRVLVW